MTVDVREVDFAQAHDAIRQVRTAVFVEEQGVPPELEMDDRDRVCRHVLVVIDGVPVGTGRIDAEKLGKIGRVAVQPSHRRHGVGTAIMAALHHIARDEELTRVWCHAQQTAIPFYERLGYTIVGEPFEEAGIPHVTMESGV